MGGQHLQTPPSCVPALEGEGVEGEALDGEAY